MPDPTPVPVIVRGKHYATQMAAGRAHGVSGRTVAEHLDRHGHLDRLGMGWDHLRKPLEVDGVPYLSRQHAMRARGCGPSVLYHWFKNGRARDLSGGGDA